MLKKTLKIYLDNAAENGYSVDLSDIEAVADDMIGGHGLFKQNQKDLVIETLKEISCDENRSS